MNHRDSELLAVASAKDHLPDDRRQEFDTIYASHRRDYGIATVLSVLWGLFGVDRFYIGHTGVGFAKLFTLGGLFIWAFVDLFLIRAAAADVNATTARQIATSLDSSRSS